MFVISNPFSVKYNSEDPTQCLLILYYATVRKKVCTKINNIMLLTHSIPCHFMSFQSDIEILLMEQ